MKKLKNFLKSPAAVLILFIVAAALILSGGIGGTRAALSVFSEQYNSQLQLSDIGISLLENGTVVGRRDYVPNSKNYEWTTGGEAVLCKNLLGEEETLKLGKAYDEVLSVQNSGHIDEYVRVIVRKYWVGDDLEKRQDLDPDLIKLNFLNDQGWIQAESDRTAFSAESTVYYYTKILAPGETSAPLTDKLAIDDKIASVVSEETSTDASGATVITVTYEYNGVQFVIEAEADAVQTHNAEAAILSAWGKHATFSGDTITGID